MGVHSLWELLLPTARRLSIQQLEGLTLAVDASIWIVKVQSIFNNMEQMIQSLFNKILMLLQNGIRPVFVFDGTPPVLKRNTLEKRRLRQYALTDLEIKKMAQFQALKAIRKRQSSKQTVGLNRQNNASQVQNGASDSNNNNVHEESNLEGEAPLNQEDFIRIQMQSKIVNEELAMLLQEYPYLGEEYSLEELDFLSLEQRKQILRNCKKRVAKHIQTAQERRQSRMENRRLEEYESIFKRDVERMKKNARIFQMKEKAYRQYIAKVSVENGEDGKEKMKGSYGGKTFEQSRIAVSKNKIVNKNMDEILEKGRRGWEEEADIEYEKQEARRRMEMERAKKLEEEIKQKEEEALVNLDLDKIFREANAEDGNKQLSVISDTDLFDYDDNDDGGAASICINPRDIKENARQSQTMTRNSQSSQANNEQAKPDHTSKQEEQEHPPHLLIYTAPQVQPQDSANLQLKQLLNILGLPYLVAPCEAQAQCAFLQTVGLVDGIITEDSDAFLFGARNVYRGVFQNDIKYYSMETVVQELGLTRMKAIGYALFLGSDYTEGIKGIGMVNAMEILSVFNTIQRWVHFREWAKTPDELLAALDANPAYTYQEKKFFDFHKNFKNHWCIDDSFPDFNVVNEYLNPKVDQSLRKFEFTSPNLTILQKVLRAKFQKYDERAIQDILSLLEKRNADYKVQKAGQKKITDYFANESEAQRERLAKIRSKRLLDAVQSRAPQVNPRSN